MNDRTLFWQISHWLDTAVGREKSVYAYNELLSLSEWVSEWTLVKTLSPCEWCDWLIESINERVDEWLNEWVSEWVQVTPSSLGDWLSDWMSDRWLNEYNWTVVSWWLVAWLSQWMNEWMSAGELLSLIDWLLVNCHLIFVQIIYDYVQFCCSGTRVFFIAFAYVQYTLVFSVILFFSCSNVRVIFASFTQGQLFITLHFINLLPFNYSLFFISFTLQTSVAWARGPTERISIRVSDAAYQRRDSANHRHASSTSVDLDTAFRPIGADFRCSPRRRIPPEAWSTRLQKMKGLGGVEKEV